MLRPILIGLPGVLVAVATGMTLPDLLLKVSTTQAVLPSVPGPIPRARSPGAMSSPTRCLTGVPAHA